MREIPGFRQLPEKSRSSEEEITLLAKGIAEYSSGITDVQPAVLTRDGRRYYCVIFRLDESAVKETLAMNGRTVTAGESGGYVITLPRDGEFACEFGELENNGCRVLHKDSFCMK